MNGLIFKAINFAALKHSAQRRKNPNKDPYINHPIEVVAILAEHGYSKDEVTLCAGVLHDVLEDTDCTREDLITKFGDEITNVVLEVSDDKSKSKLQRKKAQIEKMKTASTPARAIKIADKISNCSSALEVPPKGWTNEDVMEYIAWSKCVVDSCMQSRVMPDKLYLAFNKIYVKAKSDLGYKEVELDEIMKRYYAKLENV